jgi:type II secretory pathway component GspD/PulD (secretin)
MQHTRPAILPTFSTIILVTLLTALSGCAAYDDEVRPPTEQQLADARTKINPANALQEGVFHMQRIQQGSAVRVKDPIILKKPDLPKFDVAYIGRDLEGVVLELANAAGESVVVPSGLRGQTVTVVHSGANFPQMLELVLGKAGYSYNYIDGVWYITRLPVRNYVLEIGQGGRKGSLMSKAELNPELAAGTSTAGGSELDTDYSDQAWAQVRETMGELIKVGNGGNAGGTPAGGVGADGQLLAANAGPLTTINVTTNASQQNSGNLNNALLPPPIGTNPDNKLFNAQPLNLPVNLPGVNVATISATNRIATINTPQSTDHTAPADDGQPWFRITETAGLITVRASPEAHRQIEDYLAQVQSSAHRQVVVEARIVALIKDKTTDRGVDVSVGVNNILNSGASSALNKIGFFGSERIDTGALGGGFFQLSSNGGDMSLVIQSLSKIGDVYTISSPKLLARNNQMSRVSITRQLGYAETKVDQNTTSTGDIVVGARQDTARFKNAGTVMSVLPFIGKNRVQLRFRLSVASQSGETEIRTSIGTGTPVINTVPEMSNNVVDQDLMLEFGRIYAIGGLIENSTNVANSYEPTLRQIPGLGDIFQRAKNRGQDTEFLVLLKVSRS